MPDRSNIFGDFNFADTLKGMYDKEQQRRYDDFLDILKSTTHKPDVKDIADKYKLVQTKCPCCQHVFRIRVVKAKLSSDSKVQVSCPECGKTLRLRVSK